MKIKHINFNNNHLTPQGLKRHIDVIREKVTVEVHEHGLIASNGKRAYFYPWPSVADFEIEYEAPAKKVGLRSKGAEA